MWKQKVNNFGMKNPWGLEGKNPWKKDKKQPEIKN